MRRARAALDRARGRTDVDVPVDPEVVERLARALESRSVDALAALLAEDVWGVVDGGGVVQVARRPTFGARALLRRFANLSRRVSVPVACRVVRLNAEPAVARDAPERRTRRVRLGPRRDVAAGASSRCGCARPGEAHAAPGGDAVILAAFASTIPTIGAILAAMALLALIETAVPLHPRGRWNHLHLRPNLALTFLTFATNVVYQRRAGD